MTGKPFDMQEHLRMEGRVRALKDVLTAAGTSTAADAKRAAERALEVIGHRVAIEQALPDCPEAWLEGTHDIEQALREAIAQYDAAFPR